MIRCHPVAFAMLAFLLVAVTGILLHPLTPIDETRHVSVAWEMHLTGGWLVTSNNFAPYSDKPPLLLPLWSVNRLPWRRLPLRLGFGLAAGLVLVTLWLVPAAISGGADYRNAILWQQSAGRVTESFAHARPWWFYLVLLPLLSFPLAYSPTLWRSGWTAPWRSDRGLRLCLIWSIPALVLFSLTSGKQAHYLLPELPALALIAARLSRDIPRISLTPLFCFWGAWRVLPPWPGLGCCP